MNKLINVIIKTEEDTKNAIRRIIDQLERYNYAISINPNAKKFFSRSIPPSYKTNKIIVIEGSVIALKPDYYIERHSDYKFKIKSKSWNYSTFTTYNK